MGQGAECGRNAAHELREIESIKQLKARYFRLMDTQDWRGLAEIFTPDVHVDVRGESGPEGVFDGRDGYLEFLRGILDGVRTVHHGHMPEIELLGSDRARGVWAMFDYVEFPPAPDGRRVGLRGYGHYHETYRKLDGAWRIASLKLTRLRRDPLE